MRAPPRHALFPYTTLFRSHQLFGAEREADVVRHGRQVIGPVGERNDLVVMAVLAELFEAGVQVADVRDHTHHGFAIELHHQPEDAVRGGMLGPDVDEHMLAREARFFEGAERDACGTPLRVNAGGRELELDRALAHSEWGSLPRSPRRSRSFMSGGSSSYASAMESSSME